MRGMVGLFSLGKQLVSVSTSKPCKRCLYSHDRTSKDIFANRPLQVLYFGSDDFALPSLKMLHEKRERGELAELAVVSVRLRHGRTSVRAYAEQHDLPILDWPPQLKAGQYQLGLVASFGHLLPRKLIDLFPVGVLNVHGSLLPRWRGAAPVVHALLAGDRTTGVTIMTVQPHRFDVGDIVAQEAVAVSEEVGVHQLTAQLAHTGAALLRRCLDDLPAALRTARPQPQHGVTRAPRLTAADYRVSWRCGCAALLRQSRALPAPLTAGWRGRRLRLQRLLPAPERGPAQPARPGQLLRRHGQLYVGCGDGWLLLPQLQLQGKPTMSGAEFYNGFLYAISEDQRCLDVS